MTCIALMCMGLMMYVTPVFASGEVYDVWNGDTTAVTPSGYTYTVTTAAQLAWIAQHNDAENGYAGKRIVLAANIDLDGSNRLRVWTPIGTQAYPFRGVLEGNHHLIRGLGSINAEDGVGLFGHVAASGQINDLGLSGGRIVAVGQRRVGALAGVCKGQISGCWSMVEIAMSGNVTGGLVGEMQQGSSMTDAYCCGLIRNAGDTVGVLVGSNAGSLTRIYTTGYAKNGCAFVGVSLNGADYTKCYYDRKLYFQEPGVVSNGLTAVNDTYEMFKCLRGESGWTTNIRHYPELTGFAGTDASRLSTATAYVDTICDDPVNHANDLTVSFRVDTTGGVRWSTQELAGEEWISFSGNLVAVTRPCSETDVLTTAALRDESRTVYFRPRRVEELKVGEFKQKEENVVVCWDSEQRLTKLIDFEQAKYGWGRHHYMVVRFGYDTEGELYPIDTICPDRTRDDFLLWYNTYAIKGDTVGEFLLRAYVHDERCVPDFIPCKGECKYKVLPEFDPGEIPGKLGTVQDTLYLTGGKVVIDVLPVTPATGGDGNFTYTWRTSLQNIVATTEALVGYEATVAKLYTFKRKVKDGSGCGNDDSRGVYIVRVCAPLNPGSVTQVAKKVFCSPEEAKAYTVKASPATDGTGTYMYQWYYIASGDTLPIAGATDCNLPLSGVTLQRGVDYTFVRKAKDDYRDSEWQLSANFMKVRVMLPLNAGAIETADRGRVCLKPDATGSADTTVTVGEVTPASGDGQLQYRWLRINGSEEVQVGNTATLSYEMTVTEATSFITYTYVREVKHGNCDWVRSAGAVTEEYGIRDVGELVKTVCLSELPVTVHWQDSKGNDFPCVFNSAEDTWTVTDNYNAKGCPADTTITIQVVEPPVITIDSIAKFCQSESQISVYYDQTAGDADMFYIRYSDDFANCMGRKDTMGAIDPSTPGKIIIDVPPIPEGNHYLDVQVGVNGVDCYSPVWRMKIVASLGGYVHSKFGRVLFVDNNPNNGELPAPKLHFKAYQWYKNGVKVEGQTGQYYQENGNELKGRYCVQLTDDNGIVYRSCDIDMPNEDVSSSSAPPLVYPVPVGAGEPIVVSCCGGRAEICSCTGEVLISADCPDENVTVSAPRIAGIYYVRITHTDGSMLTEKLIVK